ncbi:F0F1 ATP synthase subunit delta [Effusibacillus lacus]|uniref:ATP synthase subunit delta n=1 Tax=Effusibacillus lacus TaxID=1348429 RepID=A0A292YGF8_9BACL|nr:F0F1 ATP synthase subunit delta [Effusibacillus lacus]TCS71826.1 ATP synthase F1 subcomplex delta subunit [Effusibacillus lacus]GAX89607.1 ATP synthase subunit delta [Effusibacillus lacus]
MLGGAVAKRYADALFSIAKEQNVVDGMEADLSTVLAALHEYPELKRILQHPAISADVKKRQVNELFGKAISRTALNLLNLLLDRRREDHLEFIYEEYVRLANEHRGQVKAHVETAVPMSENDLNELGEKLGAACGKKLDITSSVNPELIAGVRLQVGGRVIDASIKGQLDRFSQNLKRNQVR